MKDHLGNIRAVVTNEIQRRSYIATMEDPNAAAEELLFYNIPATREDKPIVYPYDPTYTPNWKISGLNASAGKPIGHAKVLEAMEGEMVDIDAKYFYSSSPFVPSNIRPIEDILSQMAAIFFLNPPSSIAESRLEVRQDWANETFLNNQEISNFLSNTFDLADQNNPNRDRPRAFLIYMFFNSDFRFNPDASGLLQVTDPDQLRDLAVLGLTLPSNGYLYVYVSNESAKDVNFDNLQIGHYTTHLTEVNDYYPYGLLMNNHSTGGITPQNYKYNGKELQKDLMFNVEDYGARFYDPVIGQWLQVDPLAEKHRKWSPYNYCIDNPIRFVDPDGRDIINIAGGVRFTGNDAQVLFAGLKSNNFKGAIHFVYQSKSPGIYKHTLNAFRQGKPEILHYDSDKNRKDIRRKLALGPYPIVKGMERDEYPYASTFEGGLGASVEYVQPGENSSQGGDLSVLYSSLKTGDPFLVVPVPATEEKETVPQPNPVPIPPIAVPMKPYRIPILDRILKFFTVPIFLNPELLPIKENPVISQNN